MKVFIVTDQAKRVADFSAKNVDLTHFFFADERDQIRKNRPDAGFGEVQGIASYIYMRTDKAPWNDKRVRQAMSMAINRKALKDALSKGEGVNDQALFVGLTGIARQVSELGATAKYWEFNPGEAKALLKAAGYEKIDTTWDHADASVYQQPYVDFASLIQAQWKEVGINAKDNMQPYAQYVSTTYQGNYENLSHSPRSLPYYLDHLSEQFYWSSSGQRARINLSYVNDPRLNALLDKQRGQFDLQERVKTFREIEDLIAEEQWQIYGTTDTRSWFWSPDIQNYRPTPFFSKHYLMKAWRDR